MTLHPLQAEALDVVYAAPAPVCALDVARATKVPVRSAAAALRRLCEHGHIERVGYDYGAGEATYGPLRAEGLR